MKSLTFLLMFFLSTLFAQPDLDKYRLFVTKIDPEFHCFELSNHMVFTLHENEWKALPELGAEVYINGGFWSFPNSNHEAVFLFEYPQEKKPFHAWIAPASKQYGLSCVLSEPLLTEPASFVFSSKYQDVVQLSDGSRWMKTNHYKALFGPESRLIVSKQKDGSYSIIELDESDYPCKCQALAGRSLPWHRYEQVEPYVTQRSN